MNPDPHNSSLIIHNCPSCAPSSAPNATRLSPPSLAQVAANFTGALLGWAAAGFPVVSRETLDARVAACRSCPNWTPTGWGGWGQCRLCGCAKAKLWLATEKCPAKPPRW
jgi:hypothetical protein